MAEILRFALRIVEELAYLVQGLVMLKKNAVQFAVMREDPLIELALIDRFKLMRPVLIGSGGCTALCIASRHPQMNLTLIEPNPAQVQLVRKKIQYLKKPLSSIHQHFGVSSFEGGDLIESGNFESLFRQFRTFLFEFIAPKEKFLKILMAEDKRAWQQVFKHPYWPIAFELFFSDSLLLTMFGRGAIQHAPEESYPKHFRRVIEAGLQRSKSSENYFLHSIFFGRYFGGRNSLPIYLGKIPRRVSVEFFLGKAQDYNQYSKHDFVSLSNIFDWSSQAEVKELAKRLSRELRPGAVVLYRQLNNSKNFRPFFRGLEWLNRESEKLFVQDRSLFYSSLHVGRKMK